MPARICKTGTHISYWNAKWRNHFEKQCGSFLELNMHLPFDTARLLIESDLGEVAAFLYKDTHVDVYSGLISAFQHRKEAKCPSR
jgi:hypothetical protein